MKLSKELVKASKTAQQDQQRQAKLAEQSKANEEIAMQPRGVALTPSEKAKWANIHKEGPGHARLLYIRDQSEYNKTIATEYSQFLSAAKGATVSRPQSVPLEMLRKAAQDHFLSRVQQVTTEVPRTRQIAALVARNLPDTRLVERLGQGDDKLSVAKSCHALATHLTILDCILRNWSSLANSPSFFASDIGALLAAAPQDIKPVRDTWLHMTCVHGAVSAKENPDLTTSFLSQIPDDSPPTLPCGCDLPRVLLEATETFFDLSRKNILRGVVRPESIDGLRDQIVRVIGMLHGVEREACITFMMAGFDAEPERFASHVMMDTGSRLLPLVDGAAKTRFQGTLLQLLIRKGDVAAMETLIQSFGDISFLKADKPNTWTRQSSGPLADTPLHMVARRDDLEEATKQAALLIKAEAPLRALRSYYLCDSDVNIYFEEPIMTAAHTGNTKLVQALGLALDAREPSEADKQVGWEQRVEQLERTFNAAKQSTDKNFLSKEWVEFTEALSNLVLVDGSLAHDKRIHDGTSLLISLQNAYLADYFYWHQTWWGVMRTAADELKFRQDTMPESWADRATTQEMRIAAVDELAPVIEKLSFLANDTQRALARHEANVSAPIDTWLDAFIASQETGDAPRAVRLYNRYGAEPTQLLVTHGPGLSIEEHSLLIATLLLRGAGTKQVTHEASAVADRSLLQHLISDEQLAKRPEVIEKVIFAALACDALPWLKTLTTRLQHSNAQLFSADNACEKASLLKALSCGTKEFSFVLKLVRYDTLRALCVEPDSQGDNLLHVLAQEHAGLVPVMTSRLESSDLQAALALENIGGQTLFGELVACAKTDVIAKLLEQHPGVEIHIPEPLMALMRRPGRSLNALIGRQDTLPELFAIFEPHLAALAVELARTGDMDALLLLARKAPHTISATKLNEPCVLHFLAESNQQKAMSQLLGLLDDKAIRSLVAHRDHHGRNAQDLGEIPQSYGASPQTKTSVKTGKKRSAAQKEAAALKRATIAVISATSHQQCTEAITNFIQAAEAQLAGSKIQSPERKQATSEAAWTVLATLNRWDELALGAHFSAHRPDISLAALKKRGIRLGLSASSRFHHDDGLAILQARASAITAAQEAQAAGLLRWKRFERVEQMHDIEGGDGYLRTAQGEDWLYIQGATRMKFVFGLRDSQPVIVSAYPILSKI